MNTFIRRLMINLFVATTWMLVLFGCGNKEKKPYNILFIAVDDLRPELGCYGVSYVKAPNIDKLASGGIRFDRAFCSVSWCAPSRTSLFTGRRPDVTGVTDLKTHFREKLPDVVTLPQYFKNNGYLSLGFGKLYHNSAALQDDLSWNEPCWIPPGKSPILAYAMDQNIQMAHQDKYRKANATERGAVNDNAYPDGQITDKAIEALKKVSDNGKPFFMGVGYYKPHLPFTAPEKYWNMYNQEEIPLASSHALPEGASKYMFRGWSETGSYKNMPEHEPYSDSLSVHLKHGYLACVSFIDAQIGLLMEELEELKLHEHTIVVVWGDHGWKLGDYGRWSKHSNMEVDTRVPLILYIPGRAPEVCTNIVETIDLYPTLVQLAGLEIPPETDGENLFDKKRNFALSQIPRDTVMGYTIRTDRYRYIEWTSVAYPDLVLDRELYDHRTSRDELENIIDQFEDNELLDHMSKTLRHQ